MSRAILCASRDPDILYWPNRRWEKMFLHNTTFERDGVNDIDARTLWHYQAIVVSPNLVSTTPGQGTAYLTAFRENKGFFVVFRFYGPLEGYIEKTWVLNDFELMK